MTELEQKLTEENTKLREVVDHLEKELEKDDDAAVAAAKREQALRDIQ